MSDTQRYRKILTGYNIAFVPVPETEEQKKVLAEIKELICGKLKWFDNYGIEDESYSRDFVDGFEDCQGDFCRMGYQDTYEITITRFDTHKGTKKIRRKWTCFTIFKKIIDLINYRYQKMNSPLVAN